MVFQTRIHLVLLRNKLKRLWIWLKISRELPAERAALCPPTEWAHQAPWGWPVLHHREAHTPPDQGGSEETGSSQCWPQQPGVEG